MANGKCIETNALLDTGSQLTLLRSDIASKIGLDGPCKKLKFGTFHGLDHQIDTKRISFSVTSIDNSSSFNVEEAYSISCLNLSSIVVNTSQLKSTWSHLKDLNIMQTERKDVALLIGMNVRGAHDVFQTRRATCKGPAPDGVLTPFGWIAVGSTGRKIEVAGRSFHVSNSRPCNHDFELCDSVDRFWSKEALGTCPTDGPLVSAEDKQAIALLNSSIRHTGEGTEAALIWKAPNISLPDNRQVALRRIFALEARFKRDPEYARGYSTFIDEYIAMGHARRVTADDPNPSGRDWYLPHHGVASPSRPGKIRVVHDAPVEFRGVSLNKSLLKGLDWLISLPGILSGFR